MAKMKAKLLIERPAYTNEWEKPKILKPGTIVEVTGRDEATGRFTGRYGRAVLCFTQDEAEVKEG